MPKVLIVDDEAEQIGYLRTMLEVHAFDVEVAEGGAQAVERVRRPPTFDLVLLDMMMPEMDGITTLQRLRQISPDLRVVMLSNLTDTRRVAAAARMGAADYFTKPLRESDLRSLLGAAANADSAGTLEAQPVLQNDGQILALSPVMKRVCAQALQLAPIDVPVLILGESGSGKEVLARFIHRHSARAHGPFVKINCAALPKELLESELFGYEAGAFTGAVRATPGRFEMAEKGTLLLDEIGEMPPLLQAKLLHFLQDGTYSRLGGRKTMRANVRVLSATNIDVKQAIEDKQFRTDLYYRLNTFTIQIPPLRERREAIPSLLRRFMTDFAELYSRPPLPFSQALMDACLLHPWPGNVRELENFVKRYLILGDEEQAIRELQQTSMPVVAAATARSIAASGAADLKSLVRDLKGEAEAEAIAQALQQTGGVRKAAARQLNISYKALLYKMRMYGLETN